MTSRYNSRSSREFGNSGGRMCLKFSNIQIMAGGGAEIGIYGVCNVWSGHLLDLGK